MSLTGCVTLEKSLCLSGTMGSLHSVALRHASAALAELTNSLGSWGLGAGLFISSPNICAPSIRRGSPTYPVILRRDMEEGAVGVGK